MIFSLKPYQKTTLSVIAAIRRRSGNTDDIMYYDRIQLNIRYDLEDVGGDAELLGGRMKFIFSSFASFINEYSIEFDADMPKGEAEIDLYLEKYETMLNVILFMTTVAWG